jgi:hypothetical protein
MRLIAYGEQVKAGKVVGDAVVSTRRPRPGLLALDASAFAADAPERFGWLARSIEDQAGAPLRPARARGEERTYFVRFPPRPDRGNMIERRKPEVRP